MGFKIPFTFSSIQILKKRSKFLYGFFNVREDSPQAQALKEADSGLNRREYLSVVGRSFIHSFFFLGITLTVILWLIGINSFYLISAGVAFMFSSFISFSQIAYPRIYVMRRQKKIEKNLLPALEDMVVQLSSGIPLFSVLVNISMSDYGELSTEFKKAVRQINAGAPEQEVLTNLSKKNPSVYFKRTLWQISNGLNAGSDMVVVVKESIKALNEEQTIQIQNYGNKLNPLMVFYMLLAVIVPALSITFLTIFSSMVGMQETTVIVAFFALFIGVMLVQIMFLGLIKSKRPSLL